ncbi:hypothetical protein D3C71_1973960 [compost metagenome]
MIELTLAPVPMAMESLPLALAPVPTAMELTLLPVTAVACEVLVLCWLPGGV